MLPRTHALEAMHVLAAEGLTLEPQTAAHAEEMFIVLADPAIYELEDEPPPSVAWLRERFAKLESRRSPDGSEHWLNWVVRLSGSELIGYVQATARPDGDCFIAYVLSSAHWGKGHARRAVEAMLAELAAEYGVRTAWAAFKTRNTRSVRLLERLGFRPASREDHVRHGIEPDERLMTRSITTAAP